MAEEKKILFGVEFDMHDAPQKIAALNDKISKLRETQARLQIEMKGLADTHRQDTEQYRQKAAELAANNEAQKAYRKEIGEVSRRLQNTIIYENKYKDTLKGKAAQLSVEKDKLREIKIAGGVLTDEYIRQQQVVNKLNTEVSTLEQAYGVYTRNVGNYKSGVQELNQQLREHLQRLSTLKQGSKEWEDESKEIRKVTGELDALNKEQEDSGKGAMSLRDKLNDVKGNLIAVFGVIAAGYKAVKGLLSELAEKTQSWGDTFKFEVAGMKSAYDSFIRSLASGAGWNELISNMKNAYANGKRFAAMLDEIFERENSLKITEAEYAVQIEESRLAARNTTLSYNERLAAAEKVLELETKVAETRREIAKQTMEAQQGKLMTQTGMTEEQVRAFINEYNQNRELIKKATEYEKLFKEFQALSQNNPFSTATPNQKDLEKREELRKQTEQMWAAMSEDERRYVDMVRKYNLSNDELVSGYVEAYAALQRVDAEFVKANARTMQQRDIALKEVLEGNGEAAARGGKGTGSGKSGADLDKQLADEETKRLEAAKRLSDAMLAQQKQYEYDSAKSAAENAELKWQHEQLWAKQQFDAQDLHERALLRVKEQYNQITREQYDQEIQILDAKQQAFYREHEQSAVEHYAKITETIAKTLIDNTTKTQIQQVKDEYKAMYLSLEHMEEAGKIKSEEAAYYRVALKEREAEEIKHIQQQETDEQEKADAERAKKRAEQLSNDLKLAWKNAEQQYQIRKEYLQRELELYKDNAAKRAELEQQLAALESQHQQEKIDRLNEYTQQVGEVISNFADLTATVGENRIERYEEENEQEKQALDKRLKAGLISQEQYNSKVEDMDADLAAKKAAETRKQAALQKAVSAFEIVTNTAAAIMKIWAEVPKIDFGVSTMALTATAAAAGALQLGSVLAEPLPKARKGGLVKGASHEQGGVLLEVEGDERIVAAKPSRAFPELLNLISYIGKQQGQGSVNTYNELKGVIGAAEQGHDIVRTEKINEQVEQVLTYIRENGGVQQHREAFREIRELVQYVQTNTETTRKDITREQQRQTEQDILRTLQQNVVTESKHNETDIERQRVHDETTLRNITREQERRVQEEIIRSEQERIHTESSRSEQNIERQRDIERLQDIERQRTIDRIREEQQRSVEEDMKREQERVRTDSTFERIRNVVTQMYVEQAAQRGQGVPRAAAGGTLVEMEGNERIIAANPTRMFPELLNLISYIGKHAAIPQTGYSERQYAQMLRGAGSNDSVSIDIDYERLAALIGEQVVAGVRNTPIYLSLTELRDAQQQQAHIDQLTRQ